MSGVINRERAKMILDYLLNEGLSGIYTFIDIVYDGDEMYFLEDNPGLADEFINKVDREFCEETAEQEGYDSCEELLESITDAVDMVNIFYEGNPENFSGTTKV